MAQAADDTNLASSLSRLHIDPQVSSQIFESQELVGLLASLWRADGEPGVHPIEEWPKLPQLCRATRLICDSIGRRRLVAYGLTDDMRRQGSSLRTLADMAEIYLLGGSGQPQMACRVVSGAWRLEPLSPLPAAAHEYEISAVAVGRFVYVTSDVDHHLGAQQEWEYRDTATQMPEGRAHVARLDVSTGTWKRIDAPPPREDERLRACAVSGCLGTLNGALLHTGGARECLRRHPVHAHNPLQRRYTCGTHVLWRAPQPGDGTRGLGCPGDGAAGDAWGALQPMRLERCNHSLCEHGGYLYAAGGCPPAVTAQSVQKYEHFFGGPGASGGRYDLSVERFDGRSWELVAPVPWEHLDARACSLQLVVCAEELHALLIGFDAFLDPRVSLLGSPLVAHGRHITIFGATSDGHRCAHTLECSSATYATRAWGGEARVGSAGVRPSLVDARYRWLPTAELSGCEPGVACPSEWTAGVALPVGLT